QYFVTGATNGKYIQGNEILSFPLSAGPRTLTIGDAGNNYAPVTFNFANITHSGTWAGSTIQTGLLTGSDLDANHYVDRVWSLTMGGGLQYTTVNNPCEATATFAWQPGNNVGTIDSSKLVVAQVDGFSWTYYPP